VPIPIRATHSVAVGANLDRSSFARGVSGDFLAVGVGGLGVLALVLVLFILLLGLDGAAVLLILVLLLFLLGLVSAGQRGSI